MRDRNTRMESVVCRLCDDSGLRHMIIGRWLRFETSSQNSIFERVIENCISNSVFLCLLAFIRQQLVFDNNLRFETHVSYVLMPLKMCSNNAFEYILEELFPTYIHLLCLLFCHLLLKAIKYLTKTYVSLNESFPLFSDLFFNIKRELTECQTECQFLRDWSQKLDKICAN